MKTFKEFMMELNEEKHKQPYTKEDLRVLREFIKTVKEQKILKVLRKVQMHMVEELEKGI